MRRTRVNCLPAAVGVVMGALLVLAVAGHRSSAQDHSLPEPEIRRGVPVQEGRQDADASGARRAAFYDRLAAKAERDRRGDGDRLPQYLGLFTREVVKDARLFAFDVRGRAVKEGDGAGGIILDGFIEYPEQRDALLSYLRALGFGRIDDRTATSPGGDRAAGGFALVNSPRAFLFDKPASPRETVSECTIGEGLFVLKEAQDGHLLCHAADGYVGYVRAEQVVRVDREAFDAYRGGERAVVLQSVDHEDVRLPVGATLKAAGDGVVLPDGRMVRVDPKHIRRITPDPRIERIIETALAMAGTKYVWGGKTADGIDCSGLVQLAYRAHGVHLPRDSDQQAHVGALVATRWHRSGLRRGDTLFFMGRHGTITHTAIYLGDGRYIEAAGPDVRISSFDPADKAYAERNARSFCFARRILE